ncbi:MAG: hypothetical protein IPI50_11260 [Saprospiraceae bacterium]|nr:hypothetical protein [Saprospiraceae bacterium]
MFKVKVLYFSFAIFLFSCEQENCDKDFSNFYNQSDLVFLINDTTKVDQVEKWIKNSSNLYLKCELNDSYKHKWNIIRPMFVVSDTLKLETWNCLRISENANPERQKLIEKAIRNGVKIFLKSKFKIYPDKLLYCDTAGIEVFFIVSQNIENELDSIVNTFDCSKLKEVKYVIINPGMISGQGSYNIFKNQSIDSVIDELVKVSNTSQKLVAIGKTLIDVQDEIDVNPYNWFLYYLKARILCIQKLENYENEAVELLATSARYALSNGSYKDSLITRINYRKSEEFAPLFVNETLYKAKLSGTVAGLESGLIDIVNVPLYFLTASEVPEYTKGRPIVYFEKTNSKPYVSKGLEKEIAITISNQDNNGTVTFDLIDKTTRSTIDNVTLGKGKQQEFNLKGHSNSLYITNLTHSDKPFIALAIETDKKKGEGENRFTEENLNVNKRNSANSQKSSGKANISRFIDTDLDGIEDNKDNCPERKGTISNNGCPVVTLKGSREFYIGDLNSISVEYDDFQSTDKISWSGNDPLKFTSKNGREIEISSDIVGKFRVSYEISNNNDHFNVTNSVVYHAKISAKRLQTELMNLAKYGNNKLLKVRDVESNKKKSEDFLEQCLKGDISISKSSGTGGRFNNSYQNFKDELLSVKRSAESHIKNIEVDEIQYDTETGKIISFRYSIK